MVDTRRLEVARIPDDTTARAFVEARLPSGERWWPGMLVERAMLRTG